VSSGDEEYLEEIKSRFGLSGPQVSGLRGVVAEHGIDYIKAKVETRIMVVRLKRAGLVIFGKTHAPEFGLSTSSESRLFGATRIPCNLEYSAGGSSGGDGSHGLWQ
jgi:amidase